VERFFVGYNLGFRAISDDGNASKYVGSLTNKQNCLILHSIGIPLYYYTATVVNTQTNKQTNVHLTKQATNEPTESFLYTFFFFCSSFSKLCSKVFVKQQ